MIRARDLVRDLQSQETTAFLDDLVLTAMVRLVCVSCLSRCTGILLVYLRAGVRDEPRYVLLSRPMFYP